MEIQLSEDLRRFIEIQVTGGRYPSHRDVVETALRRMREQDSMPPRLETQPADGENGQVDIAVHSPNVTALAILQAVKRRREGRSASDSTRTQDYLREARSGKMYGHGDDARESTNEHDD